MTDCPDQLQIAWWANNLGELDREIARLALLCRIRILDPGVLERALQRDESVCGTQNPIAFAKLHDLLLMHYAIQKRAAKAVGAVQAAQIEDHVIDALRKRFAAQIEDLPRS